MEVPGRLVSRLLDCQTHGSVVEIPAWSLSYSKVSVQIVLVSVLGYGKNSEF